jgi:hypothetical protein
MASHQVLIPVAGDVCSNALDDDELRTYVCGRLAISVGRADAVL